MKRILVILLALLAVAGCGKKTSLKVTDPAERAALRTRDASCPIDSVLTPSGLKTTFDFVSQVKPRALAKDFKEAKAVSAETKPLAIVKDAYATVKKDHSEDYNPGLSIYMTVMIIAFVVIVLIKTFRAIFKNS